MISKKNKLQAFFGFEADGLHYIDWDFFFSNKTKNTMELKEVQNKKVMKFFRKFDSRQEELRSYWNINDSKML